MTTDLDLALDQDGVPLGTDIAQNIASSATRDSAWMRIVDALDAFTLDYEPSDDEIEAARSR